MILIM